MSQPAASSPARGVFIPPFDDFADARVLAGLAQEAEAAGWDGFFLWDHIQYAEPVGAIADPWTCLTAIALSTERLRLGTMITPLARRRPWVLARQVTTLDRLSGGRLILGLGVGGGTYGEWEGFGEETTMRGRAALLDDGLALLEALWSGAEVDHRGSRFTVRSRPFLPRPVRPEGIPVWIGARWPPSPALRRAARWDGVFPIDLKPDDVPALMTELAALRPDPGRPFDVVVRAQADEDHAPWRRSPATWLLTDLGPRPDGRDGFVPTRSLSVAREVIAQGPGPR